MTKAIVRDQHRKHIYQKADFLDKAYLSPDREHVLELNRAVALRYVAGSEMAKAEDEELAGDLEW